MYDSFYGLCARPFRLNPDPRFFFQSSVHGRALAYLRYGLVQGEGFVVITGEPGSGKTLLMRTLVAERQSPQLETIEIVTSLLDGDDILQLLSASLNIPTHGVHKGELLALLRNYLFSRSRQGVRVLALIDEAHDLTPRAFEELRMLSNFQFGDRTPLQCFLLGHDTLLHRLGTPDMVQFRQRVIATCHLHPLTAKETRKYVEFRLTRACWQGSPHFTDGAFALLHQYTGGVPRRINTFCDRLLLFAAMEEIRAIDEHTVLAAIHELEQESPQQAALDLVDENEDDIPTISGVADPTYDLFGADCPPQSSSASPDNKTSAPFDASPVGPKADVAAAASIPPPTPTQHPEPQLVGDAPRPKKTILIIDESAMEDDVQGQPATEAEPSELHVAPTATDKALVSLRHAWQVRRRRPAWIAAWATTVVVFAMLGVTELTNTPDQPSPLATPRAESFATTDLPANIELPSAAPDKSTATVSIFPSEESIRVEAPPADIGDEVIASIAPMTSGPPPPRAAQASLDRSAIPQQSMHWLDRVAPSIARPAATSARRATTGQFEPALPIPHHTAAAETRASPTTSLAAPLQRTTTPDDPSLVVSREPTNGTAPATNDGVATNQPATGVSLDPPQSVATTAMVVPATDAATRVAARTADNVADVDALNGTRLEALLLRFESAYQAGDVPQLTHLFATDARTADARGRGEISRLYQRLFAVTDRRAIGIDNVLWEIRNDRALGHARFVVTVVEKGEHAPRTYTGKLSIVVEPDQDGLAISQLYHEYAPH